MAFTKLKSGGQRVRVDLAKVVYFTELESGSTSLSFINGDTLVVEESFQTVSNRANGSGEVTAAVSVAEGA
jgi:hypothetical protein